MDKLQNILVLANLVIALLGAGVVYYSHNMIKPAPTDQVAEAENLKNSALEQTRVKAIPIKKFAVNLHSKSSKLRYLDIEMNILPFNNDQAEIIKANEYIFKDVVIEIASQNGPEDLETLSGKILLENKIKKQVNAKLGQPVIKQIYFSGFVVQ
jgi:flagellar FliL protein